MSVLRLFVFDVFGLAGFLERHGHAEGDSSFPFADLSLTFEPSPISVAWSGLQAASDAFFDGKQRAPRVNVNCRTIESGAYHVALQAQHSESDLKSVGNLCDEPEGSEMICSKRRLTRSGSARRRVRQNYVVRATQVMYGKTTNFNSLRF
jgi:hypothetical protein